MADPLEKVLLGMAFFNPARRYPNFFKRLIVGGAAKALQSRSDAAKHFSPDYKTWDQRLCMVPDMNLFQCIRQGRASVVTNHIDRFTPGSIKLRSGEEIAADVVVTATELDLLVMGGTALSARWTGSPGRVTKPPGACTKITPRTSSTCAMSGLPMARWSSPTRCPKR